MERAWGTEVWYPAGDLLIKYITTRERLSVQVHPDNDYARRHENSPGKTEMWYIVRAAPESRIALGFLSNHNKDDIRKAAVSGEIVGLLHWWPAKAGDVFFVPAGTVHAIGGGIELWEIQQNSDVTYRLYDYGRGRPLHLDKALDVAHLGPHPGPGGLPAGCTYFAVDLIDHAAPGLLIALDTGAVWNVSDSAQTDNPGPGRLLWVSS
ncbi:MAG: class I mannose-6-phosphate isomerase [Bryobacteraceae bacterium]